MELWHWCKHAANDDDDDDDNDDDDDDDDDDDGDGDDLMMMFAMRLVGMMTMMTTFVYVRCCR